jgi:hypothetical protein
MYTVWLSWDMVLVFFVWMPKTETRNRISEPTYTRCYLEYGDRDRNDLTDWRITHHGPYAEFRHWPKHSMHRKLFKIKELAEYVSRQIPNAYISKEEVSDHGQ